MNLIYIGKNIYKIFTRMYQQEHYFATKISSSSPSKRVHEPAGHPEHSEASPYNHGLLPDHLSTYSNAAAAAPVLLNQSVSISVSGGMLKRERKLATEK